MVDLDFVFLDLFHVNRQVNIDVQSFQVFFSAEFLFGFALDDAPVAAAVVFHLRILDQISAKVN
jgi:hypothetical protein